MKHVIVTYNPEAENGYTVALAALDVLQPGGKPTDASTFVRLIDPATVRSEVNHLLAKMGLDRCMTEVHSVEEQNDLIIITLQKSVN